MTDNKTDPMAEITAMKSVAEAFAELDTEAIARVLNWASARYNVIVSSSKVDSRSKDHDSNGEETASLRFESYADLYAAAEPNRDADRALITAYWFQVIEGQDEFVSQAINSALKDLGHGISNITKALDSLKAQQPALVMQVRKSGSSQQARKKYKLTTAGKKAAEMLVGQQ